MKCGAEGDPYELYMGMIARIKDNLETTERSMQERWNLSQYRNPIFLKKKKVKSSKMSFSIDLLQLFNYQF